MYEKIHLCVYIHTYICMYIRLVAARAMAYRYTTHRNIYVAIFAPKTEMRELSRVWQRVHFANRSQMNLLCMRLKTLLTFRWAHLSAVSTRWIFVLFLKINFIETYIHLFIWTSASKCKSKNCKRICGQAGSSSVPTQKEKNNGKGKWKKSLKQNINKATNSGRSQTKISKK